MLKWTSQSLRATVNPSGAVTLVSIWRALPIRGSFCAISTVTGSLLHSEIMNILVIAYSEIVNILVIEYSEIVNILVIE